jgi:two-component system sensor histidine kinase/response regulator
MMINSSTKKSILLVDDEPDNLDVLHKLVLKHFPDFEIYKALNGVQGLTIAQKFIPDVIITDWEMPNMNGIQMIERLKKLKSTCNIPVIVATGVMVRPEHIQEALNKGAMDYIRKPFDSTELVARVYSMLRLSAEYRKVKELNENKDHLFSIISHDLKSPLSSLSGLLEVFNMGVLEKEELDMGLKTLSRNVHFITEVLDNILHWSGSQIKGGRIELEQVDVSVPEVFNYVINLYKTIAMRKGIRIQSVVETNRPIAKADLEGLRLIMRNLVANAVKFTGKDGNIYLRVEQDNEDFLRICVLDTGVGIPEEKKMSLFESVGNVSRGTEGEKGVGLGLQLCQLYVKSMGGEIGLSANVDQGTEIWFTIPKAVKLENASV